MSSSPVIEVIEAVADAKGVEPGDLEMSLHDHIDPEVVRRLAEQERASWSLSFELPEHDVTVTSDGLVLVDGVQRGAWNT